MIDPYLPHDVELEAKLLSAALVAMPYVRAQILDQTSRSDFFDEWHRWLFDALQSGYGLDRGPLVKHLYAKRRAELSEATAKSTELGYSEKDRNRFPPARQAAAEYKRLAFSLGAILVDFDESSRCGWVDDWQVYAAELRRMTDKRVKILCLMAELEDACGE